MTGENMKRKKKREGREERKRGREEERGVFFG